VKLFPYVVFAERLRGFDTLDEARRFAEVNVPSVVCERRPRAQGKGEGTVLVEVLRHDCLYDAARQEWRVMLG
jgi:hypothetical protein